MPRRSFLTATFVLVLAGVARAGAEDCPPPAPKPVIRQDVPGVVGQDLFDSLIGWIARNTSYDLGPTYRGPPGLSFCDVGEMVDYEAGQIMVEPVLNAAYDLSRRHIYLVRPWSAEDPFDQSVLLHEIIHDVQLQNRDWPCPGAPEFEAYWLQDKFLHEHGIAHAFDWGAILRISTCPMPLGQD